MLLLSLVNELQHCPDHSDQAHSHHRHQQPCVVMEALDKIAEEEEDANNHANDFDYIKYPLHILTSLSIFLPPNSASARARIVLAVAELFR